jgi:hypothetical protein
MELEAHAFPDYEALIERTLAEAICLETKRPCNTETLSGTPSNGELLPDNTSASGFQ